MPAKQAVDGWREVLDLCSKIESKEMCDNLLGLFLTFEERETLASRVLIIGFLLEGELTQREIASKLGVSISQITRGSNALKIIDPSVKQYLEKKLRKSKKNI